MPCQPCPWNDSNPPDSLDGSSGSVASTRGSFLGFGAWSPGTRRWFVSKNDLSLDRLALEEIPWSVGNRQHVIPNAWRAWMLKKHSLTTRRDAVVVDVFDPAGRSTNTVDWLGPGVELALRLLLFGFVAVWALGITVPGCALGDPLSPFSQHLRPLASSLLSLDGCWKVISIPIELSLG